MSLQIRTEDRRPRGRGLDAVAIFVLAVVVVVTVGCSDGTGLEPGFEWGAFEGTSVVLDRGTTYANTAFAATFAQTGTSLSGALVVGRSTFNVTGTVSTSGEVELSLELSDPGGATSSGYTPPVGFVFSGSLSATTALDDRVVEAFSGVFVGPDGFGGDISVTFEAQAR